MEVYVEKYGGVEEMKTRPCSINPDTHTLADDEVLVRNRYAGVNFIDTYFRSGLYKKPTLPFVCGEEGMGEVVRTGSSAEATAMRHKRVAYFGGSGSYSAYTVVCAKDVFPVADAVSDELAAATLIQGMTAHYLCNDSYPCGPGSTVVVHAAAGGTGSLLTQMCHQKQARVIAICGGPDKAERVRQSGDASVVIDYKAHPNWAEEVRKACPGGVDAVYDGVGKSTFESSLTVLRPMGYMISFGNASGTPDPVSPLTLCARGSVYLQRPKLSDYLLTPEERTRRMNALGDLLASKSLRVDIHKTFPLSEAAEAHRAIASGTTVGKLLIKI